MNAREARRAMENTLAVAREAERLANLASHAADALATRFAATRRIGPKGYVCITEIEYIELCRLADRYAPMGTLADGRRWSTIYNRWSSCRLVIRPAR